VNMTLPVGSVQTRLIDHTQLGLAPLQVPEDRSGRDNPFHLVQRL